VQDSNNSLSNNSNKGAALGKLHSLEKNNTSCFALLRLRNLLAYTACISVYCVAKQTPTTQEEDSKRRSMQEYAGKDRE
jgi:hypothetical protein